METNVHRKQIIISKYTCKYTVLPDEHVQEARSVYSRLFAQYFFLSEI